MKRHRKVHHLRLNCAWARCITSLSISGSHDDFCISFWNPLKFMQACISLYLTCRAVKACRRLNFGSRMQQLSLTGWRLHTPCIGTSCSQSNMVFLKSAMGLPTSCRELMPHTHRPGRLLHSWLTSPDLKVLHCPCIKETSMSF